MKIEQPITPQRWRQTKDILAEAMELPISERATFLGQACGQDDALRAERRFNDVRKLAHAVVFDYHEAIRDLPGSTPVRERLVKDALEYLDSLANEAGSDASLQRELAEAYEKIGDVQGNPYFSNLGNTAGAIASYRKSAQLREVLLAATPNDAEARRNLARSYEGISDVLRETSDLHGARQQYDRALALAQATAAAEPQNVKAQVYLAQALTSLGDIQYRPGAASLGDLSGSLEHHRLALALRERLAAPDPKDPNAQKDIDTSLYLNVTYNRLAEIYRMTGGYDEALGYVRKGQKLVEDAQTRQPEKANRLHDLAITYRKLAFLLLGNGKEAEAMEYALKSQVLRESLIKAETQPTRAGKTI
ncbi:MAG: hypothetical protein ABIP14_01835 [Blastocatellia bacterium]